MEENLERIRYQSEHISLKDVNYLARFFTDPNPGRIRTEEEARHLADTVRYTSCKYCKIGFRTRKDSGVVKSRVIRLRGGLCDVGASISVCDDGTARYLQSRNAGSIVYFETARVVEAEVAGGGVISIMGECSIEFVLFDEVASEWCGYREVFSIIQGSSPTFIIGNTFHVKHKLRLDLGDSSASYLSIPTVLAGYKHVCKLTPERGSSILPLQTRWFTPASLQRFVRAGSLSSGSGFLWM